MRMSENNGKFIKELFDPYFVAPLHLWEEFAMHLTQRTFKKNEIIKKENTIEKYINIIIEGSVGVFLWTDNHTKCLDLFYSNDFCCDYMSFVKKEPNILFTQALENTTMYSIANEDIQRIYYNSVLGLQIVRSATESLFAHKQNQQIELLTLTAEERYKKLMIERPEVIQNTAAKHIASYLGVTPESMSRIRSKV